MNILLALKLLDALMMIAANVPMVRLRLQALDEELKAARDEGRKLSDEEWEARGTSVDERLARLKAKHKP